jgi:hypothetical protein
MEIKIGKSGHQCAACASPFVHEQEMMSLVRIQDRVLVREDYCHACWSPEHATGSFSVWSPRFYDPKVAEQEPAEVFSPLRRVFYEAVESEARHELAVAYLSAQLLRRQKVFRLLKESDGPEGTVKLTLYADRIADKLIEVRDPNLSYAELDAGRRVLMERLAALEAGEPTEEQAHADAGEV